MNDSPLLQCSDVRKAFPKPDGAELLVLEGMNLELREGQIVGLLGRSGSGKSTLLRLIAGLAEPTAGQLRYLGNPISGPAPGIAMVFQSFALFPWLSVFENVALGLEAQRLPRAVRYRGLDGPALLFAGIGVQDVHLVVVADLEHVRGHLHAPSVALAQVAVDNHLHHGLLGRGSGPGASPREYRGAGTGRSI